MPKQKVIFMIDQGLLDQLKRICDSNNECLSEAVTHIVIKLLDYWDYNPVDSYVFSDQFSPTTTTTTTTTTTHDNGKKVKASIFIDRDLYLELRLRSKSMGMRVCDVIAAMIDVSMWN